MGRQNGTAIRDRERGSTSTTGEGGEAGSTNAISIGKWAKQIRSVRERKESKIGMSLTELAAKACGSVLERKGSPRVTTRKRPESRGQTRWGRGKKHRQKRIKIRLRSPKTGELGGGNETVWGEGRGEKEEVTYEGQT